ncbi:hypothetical protein TVNIR_2444 [Thioalkalivibrio nitratireducens DSM 14787]|uniref:Uncharacterized protein n=1 Tax=Thioalkalivibrio nitratireducens (strain DSM 14787 / UNIQEM 213 / ALEN2) TaxID=1255043 RepID=L0DYK2_THIND|nr:hypothetical protein TVNIR_2444 [Thioalkalivibrio nitratireducens DSM 14787]
MPRWLSMYAFAAAQAAQKLERMTPSQIQAFAAAQAAQK